MRRFLALLLERPQPESKHAALAFMLLAGLLVGLGWAALTRRAGFTRRERLASLQVPAVAAHALLSTFVVWPLDAVWSAESPLSSGALWRFGALGALTVAGGALAGFALVGFGQSPAEQPAFTARDYVWLLAGLLLACTCANFALYERFLHSYGELRCQQVNVVRTPCNWGVFPRVPSPTLGSYQFELVRQALWPSPPNPFVRPTGLVPLTDAQIRVLQVLAAAFELVLGLVTLLAATHLKSVRPAWRCWLARALGGVSVLALGFAAVVVVRSRAAGLRDPLLSLLPTSDFRELVLVAAASVAGAGCLGAFLFAPWGKGARLACAFGLVSALTVVRRVLDQAVLPSQRYAAFDIDIHGARFGVELYLLGACALLLALGVFPWHAWRAFFVRGAVSAAGMLVVTVALFFFGGSLAFARDGQVRFTRSDAVDPRVARVKSCREPYVWRDPLWIRQDVTPRGEPIPSVELDHDAYQLLRDRFAYHLRQREAEPGRAEPKARPRLVGIAADLDAPAQNVRCVLVAATSTDATVVVLAQQIEELATTLGPVARVAERCGAGRIELTDDEHALPLDPHWTLRRLLEQPREHRFNPRLDPESLPPGCR